MKMSTNARDLQNVSKCFVHIYSHPNSSITNKLMRRCFKHVQQVDQQIRCSSFMFLDGWMNGVLGHFYALSRLNWAGDNLG